MLESCLYKLHWDGAVITDSQILANRPEILLFDKLNKTAMHIGFAFLLNRNIPRTYAERINKYVALREQLE